MIGNLGVRRALRKVLEATSLDFEKLAREICPNLDLHRFMDKSYGISFTKTQKAQAISELLDDSEVFLLAARLIKLGSDDGYYYGKNHKIHHLGDLRNSIKKNRNLQYDGKLLKWVQTRDRNYELAVLRIDIVDSTGLLSKYPKTGVEKMYREVKNTVSRIGQERDGSIHKWEGDGGLLVFFPNTHNACENAALCGMAIIHSLFLYNLFENTLGENIRVRIAADFGPCRYHENIHEIHGSALIRVIELEQNHTEPNTMTISGHLYEKISSKTRSYFHPAGDNQEFLKYSVEWE